MPRPGGTRWRRPSSPGRAARRRRHRDGVGQVAGLPAARRSPGWPRTRAPACSTWRRPRRWPATSSALGGRAGRPVGAPGAPTTATPRTEERDWVRRHSRWIVTNPDMLHRGILPGPPAVVLHAAPARLRRRRRVPRLPRGVRLARRPRAAPAAADLPPLRRRAGVRAGLGDRRRAGAGGRARLVGAPVVAVTEDGSPRPGRDVRAVGAAADRADRRARGARCGGRPRPTRPRCSPTWSSAAPGRWPSSGRAAARSRWPTRPAGCWPTGAGPTWPRRVDSYRGGYLPEERRELERALSSGDAARRGHHQRPRAGHRHRRAGRGGARRLSRHAGLAVAAGRPGRAGASASRWSSSSPATIRWTTTWPTTPARCSAGRWRRR